MSNDVPMPEMEVVRFQLMIEARLPPIHFGPDERYEILIELKRGDEYQIYREPVMLSEDVSDIRGEFGRAVERIGKRIAAGKGDALRWVKRGKFGDVTQQAAWPCSPLPEGKS